MREITVQELAEHLAKGEKPYLLDVRQKWEHELARLPGSVLVPLDELRARAKEIEAGKNQLVVCYCHHGVRSLRATLVLRAAGFANAVSLRGGIEAWSRLVDPSVPQY
jgi:sulfur-carrier protein adenylyltransferase/sulfurtransferase